MAATLVGSNAGFDSIAVEDTTYVRRIYKDKGGNGYVAYVVVISSYYGTVESEELIHIGNDGVIKGIKKITFKTSDEGWGFVPPSEESVNAFYERIPGANSVTLEDVELITGATTTSTGVMNSIKEALEIADGIIAEENAKNPTPRIVGAAIIAVFTLGVALAIVNLKKRRVEGR